MNIEMENLYIKKLYKEYKSNCCCEQITGWNSVISFILMLIFSGNFISAVIFSGILLVNVIFYLFFGSNRDNIRIMLLLLDFKRFKEYLIKKEIEK